MKKKLNKILSSALTAVMIFTTLVAVIPVSAGAAYSSDVAKTDPFTLEEKQTIVAEALEYDFASAEEMLNYELSEEGLYYDSEKEEYEYPKTVKGNYLDMVTTADGSYAIYVNRYTGLMYYVNNKTGQILTSNPYNPAKAQSGSREDLMSQLVISFFLTSASSTPQPDYSSVQWAARYGQISVNNISGGLRVNYTLGDTTARFLLPGLLTAESFENNIIMPMLEKYQDLLQEHCAPLDPEYNFGFFNNSSYEPDDYGCMNITDLKKYLSQTKLKYDELLDKNSVEYDTINDLRAGFNVILIAYTQNNPAKIAAVSKNDPSRLNALYEKYPITKDGTAVYAYTAANVSATKRAYSAYITTYCPDYTFQMMFDDEEYCGYEDNSEQKPVFRCSLEYTFNEDGSLRVALPANSLMFDETVYTLEDITPLKYFGAGDMSRDGYIFYPDGSGTVVDFKDFYKSGDNLSLSSSVFGQDYCYSTVTGAHREQITMPVYGIVGEVPTHEATKTITGVDSDYVKHGFFAILEEGAPLADLGFTSSSSHSYAGAYASYVPYPSDEFDLSDTISVGSLGKYYIVSDSKYNGSYVTRIVMLTDPSVAAAAYTTDEVYYPTTYVGMATYYRTYLKNNGVLTSLQKASDDIPLYIEVLGSMKVLKKILTFPVTVSMPLTTFEDVELMYSELSDAVNTLKKKGDSYYDLAQAVTGQTDDDIALKEQYMASYESYYELAENVQNITNINFKLNGFTNGGLTATYPTKVRWESACGGKRGFRDLIEAAASKTEAGATNFGIYPDFDFMYINNTAAFDGIGLKKNVSRMVDNRYASKQFYNSILSEYESFFNLVVTPDALERLYEKFDKKYSDYNWKYISVSTMGSDLNSNFDEDNPINRNDAMEYVKSALNDISLGEYSIMLDKGNIYTVAYADHIIDACIDSSHFRYSSYAVPFWGLVLHSYVSYTGSAYNYAGSPDYEILRAIENGASLYYILCFENTSYLKEDSTLNKYYGVDYANWFDEIVTSYKKLNDEIGELQDFEIVDHEAIITERVISEEERAANLKALIAEICGFIKTQVQNTVNVKAAELQASNPNGYTSIAVSLDIDALTAKVAADLFTTTEALAAVGFADTFAELVGSYFEALYPVVDGENQLVVDFATYTYHYNDEADCGEECCGGEFKSQYRYVTGSVADDDNYRYTNYTSDAGNVVFVTYRHPETGETTKFILNYNTFSVTVKLDGKTYTLGKYDYEPIKEGQ